MLKLIQQIMYSINSLTYKNNFINWCKQYGTILNLDNPQTIQDKIGWLNIYEPNLLKTKCADKILLHEYCKDIIGQDLGIPIIAIYDNPNCIQWNLLPNQFVIKCNHGSSMNIICKDKSRLNINETIKILNQWQAIDYAMIGFELHYHDIERKILIEQYMADDKDKSKLTDYKFWCFNGKPQFIHVVDDRYSNLMHFNFYNLDFDIIDLEQTNHPKSNYKINAPVSLQQMKEYAEKLAQPFKFVRVDFYEINNIPYLGELTFTPDCCHFQYVNNEDNIKIGNLLNIKN